MLFERRVRYFTQLTPFKAIFYVVTVAYVLSVAFVVTIEPILKDLIHCKDNHTPREFPNPEYVDDMCYRTRFALLLFLTREECSFARRLVSSVVLGGIIGWERRQADRPAGIRTMALVSLASCLFTLSSAFAFRSGPQEWDASRISAAIPSGVGFLGAGLIFKGQIREAGQGAPMVHGLTTAASLWMSAAVGIGCGGALYFAASFSTAILLLLLRFGPRFWDIQDDEDEEDEDETQEETGISVTLYGANTPDALGQKSSHQKRSDMSETSETQGLIGNRPSSRKKSTIRDVPHLL